MTSSWIIFAVLVHSVLCDDKDGGKAPRIPLNDGTSIPALGLGTFLGYDKNSQREVKEGEVENPVTWALDAGYRLIDITASAYHSEEQVGAAIQKSKLPREEVFLVTKLASHEQRHVVDSLKKSLARLQLSYVDLYLIQTPVTFKEDFSGYDVIDYLDTWKGMEEAKRLGLAKSIGISNFNVTQIERLLANCDVKPSVLQVETQRGVVPIPKLVIKKLIEQNIDIFDFQLTAQEMEALGNFNKDYRTVFPSFWQDHPYYPYERKDVPDPDPFKGKVIG